MNQKFIASAEVVIRAPKARVWEALTTPELIKQYLFGTDVTTDWREGSPVTYRGEWQGKAYEDKGRVVRVEPERLLVSTFWSSLSGLPDAPEYYKTVTYALADEGSGTKVTLTQDSNASREEADHSEQNWRTVLGKLKELLER